MAAMTGASLLASQQSSAAARDGAGAETDKPMRKTPATYARDDIADMKSDLAYLRRQVHGLRSRLHGELAVLALRIEDNERRAMKRRKVARRWTIAAVVAAWLWLSPGAVVNMLHGPFLLPGLLLVAMALGGGIAIVLLMLHNEADEQDHTNRHRNWFRLTAPDDP